MKKIFIIFFISIFFSVLCGIIIFGLYKKNIDEVVNTVFKTEKVYMLLYGSYNSKEKVDKLNLSDKFVIDNNNFFEVYIGISKNLDTAKKIKGIYEKNGNNIYIREKQLDNIEMLDYLDNIEIDINKKSDEEILNIELNIIKKYKELYG